MTLVCDLKNKKEKKLRSPYEKNHKFINGIEYKLCSDCNDLHPMNEEWFYRNKSNRIDGFYPYCKKSAIKREIERELVNHEEYKERKREQLRKDKVRHRERKKNWAVRNKEKLQETLRQWQRDNPEKVREHNQFRDATKKHEISDAERYRCKKYFNFCCAYCNLTEDEHKRIHSQQLHMDHVDPNGANDLSNNIPACKSCNSTKRDYSIEYFYSIKVVSEENKNKIVQWLSTDYIKAMDNSK